MKLQHLAVIFIIIILPIIVTLSSYIQTHIDTIVKQNSYDDKLEDATYDMVKAFQLNTVNNKFSTISDSKIRDIEAAVNTFYNTLGTNLGASGYDKNTLKNYTPALLFNLYDGYYIYSKYDNQGDGKSSTTSTTTDYGLKPFIYYSARYKKNSSYDFVVNYTLDNYITIMGTVNGNYVSKSGYLVNLDKYDPGDKNSVDSSYKYDNNSITYDQITYNKDHGEKLTEFLVVLQDSGEIDIGKSKEYNYKQFNSQKYYYEDGTTEYMLYNKYQLTPISDANTIAELNSVSGSNSAFNYYKEALEFSKWVNDEIGSNVMASDIVNSKGGTENLRKYTDEDGNEYNINNRITLWIIKV